MYEIAKSEWEALFGSLVAKPKPEDDEEKIAEIFADGMKKISNYTVIRGKREHICFYVRFGNNHEDREHFFIDLSLHNFILASGINKYGTHSKKVMIRNQALKILTTYLR